MNFIYVFLPTIIAICLLAYKRRKQSQLQGAQLIHRYRQALGAEVVSNGELPLKSSVIVYEKQQVELQLTKGFLKWRQGDDFNCIALYDILGSSVDEASGCFDVHYVYPPQKPRNFDDIDVEKKPLHKQPDLQIGHVRFQTNDKEEGETWAEAIFSVMNGLPLDERACWKHHLVVVNPFSGRKRSLNILKTISPMFALARIKLTVVETQRIGHAYDLIKDLNAEQIAGIYQHPDENSQGYSAVICISGDGTLHEVVNGLLNRPDADLVSSCLPLAVIPSGSGNGYAASLGLVTDPKSAAFRIIKGKSRPIDVMEVSQIAKDKTGNTTENSKKKAVYSLLMLTFGIVSDIDFESEKIRLIGGWRFELWSVLRILFKRYYPIVMKFTLHSADYRNNSFYHKSDVNNRNHSANCKILKDTLTGDLTIEDHVDTFMVVACNVTHITETGVCAPKAKHDDGYIDLVVGRNPIKRHEALNILLNADTGSYTKFPYIEYYKVREIVIEPVVQKCKEINKEVVFDVDGERMDINSPLCLRSLQGKCRLLY